jgi:hypothetical protein
VSGGGPKILEGTCKICRTMPEKELVELDLLLQTPVEELDDKLFGDISIPPSDLPAEWQRFGPIRKCQVWLEERGHKFARQTLVAHYSKHLPAVAVASDSVRALQEGTLSDGRPTPTEPEPLKMAIEYHKYFRTGMQVGHKALELILEKLEDPDHPPTQTMILAAANLGSNLAKAQAAIVTKGMRFVLEDDGAIEGFASDDEDDPSPRFGSYRIRTIEGERRPVRDEGPADRAQYNEKAKQSGAPLLPSPEG